MEETVRFFDVDSGKVVAIPASELAPGAIRARVEGIEGDVWLLPDKLHEGEIRHPPFNHDVQDYIRKIQSAFEEHYPLSFEEWVDGFRRDANPNREIAIWSHAADVYMAFADDEPIAERRRDVYRCVATCMTASYDMIWRVFKPEVLNQLEAQEVIDVFYGN